MLEAIEADTQFLLGDWEKSVGPAYAEQIAALRRGPLFLLAKNDPAAFEKQIAQYIGEQRSAVEPYVATILRAAATRWPGFLVIDNVDQLDDPHLQEQIFVEAQALARRIGFSVIMSLRESTFLRHRDTPAFDAFQFDSFYIDPPSVLPVLSHRFAYAKRVLKGCQATLRSERGITLQVPDLGRFFELVATSLLEADTGLMIECLSGGNVRTGLMLVRDFLSSGHTNADRALAAYLLDGDYKFPAHEVLRGAVLGPHKYYNDALSLLPNLFDSKLLSLGTQLLRLRIVELAVRTSEEQPSEGLVVADTVALLTKLGVNEDPALVLFTDLVVRNMLHTVDGLSVKRDSRVYPSRLAGFALRRLSRQFAYAEFCALDTAILDPDSWTELSELTREIEATHGLADRMTIRCKRLEVFFRYLIASEDRWIVDVKRRDLPARWATHLVRDEIWPALRDNAAAALRSAERRHARAARIETSGLVTTSDSVSAGTIVNSWPEKEYVFIQEQEGTEWFAHRKDFQTETDWSLRTRGKRCVFLKGEWQGKPRAVSVRVEA